ncbi:beta/gamma crystallin domain-containing protein [Streptomyces sp. NPDC002181]|uniref:beta/gamma crystallin domain-containing protein n=1 Tax=unclassified Streptomyces TaxID=2593676 RepID=UPI0036611699
MNKSFKKIAFTIASAAVLSAVIPMSSASAIGRTDCGGRTDVVKITNYGNKQLCFANAGSQDVKIYQVDSVDPGNYRVDVVINNKTVHHLQKGVVLRNIDGSDMTITKITIF